MQDTVTTDRDSEFVDFLTQQVRRRRQAEEDFYATLAAAESAVGSGEGDLQ